MGLSNRCLAAVMVAERTTELQEFDLPDIPEDGGLLRIEAAGICGSDWPMYTGGKLTPRILGHENVGFVEKIGRRAQELWGVKEGDRVALEEYLPCGQCTFCRTGEFRSCYQTDSHREHFIRYGSTPTSVKPSLYGGYSQYLYLHPSAVLHKVKSHIPAEQAALALPLSNGIEWVYLQGEVKMGDTVVIQGPGQQGLGCVIAAKAAGAKCVIVSGLGRDSHRLNTALELGADYIVDVEKEDLLERVKEITNGEMADMVLDVSTGGTVTVSNAIRMTRKRGRVILAARKKQPIPSFDSDQILSKNLTVRGVRGHSYLAVEMALDVIAGGKHPLDKLCTHSFDLHGVHDALRTVGAEINIGAIHCTVLPWGK